jgi:hypothetical protein
MPRRATTSVRTNRRQRGRRVHLRAAPLAWLCRRDRRSQLQDPSEGRPRSRTQAGGGTSSA